MYWNHRLIKRIDDGYEQYGIYEVYYNDDGSIYAYTEEPIEVCGDTQEDVEEILQWMMNCLEKPVLVYGEIETVDPDGISDK